MNKFYGVGYLVSDLEERLVADKVVANGAIAISRRYAPDKTDFINISIWGKGAEYVLKYAKKGTMMAVSGELQIEKKNEKVYTRVNVDEFKFWNNKGEEKKEEDKPELNMEDFNIPDNFFKDDDETDLPF